MTEPMIPLSVIDAKIKSLIDIGFSMKSEFIMMLEEIKKEAIPSELEGGLHCPVCHFDYTKQKRTKGMTKKKKGFILIAEKPDSFKKFYEAMEPILKRYIKKIEKEKPIEDE